jgi:hypothetical protein
MESRESELLAMLRTHFSATRLLLLSSFPQSIADNGTYDQIIDKLEVNAQLAPGRM